MSNNNLTNTLENKENQNIFKYITQNGIYLTIYLNNSKDKIIVKLILPEDNNNLYSNEYSYETLTNEYPIFSLEENIEEIYQLLTESINNLGIDINNENKLIIKIQVNSKQVEIQLNLRKSELSEEEIISSLVEKVNNLIKERKEVCGVKSFDHANNEVVLEKMQSKKEIDELETKLNIIEKRINYLKEASLLTNSHIISDSKEVDLILKELENIQYEEEEINNSDKNGKKKENDNTINKKKNQKNIELTKENIVFKLVYRASRDGDSAEDFHKKCDNIGINITFILTDTQNKFGGFTNNNWKIPEKTESVKKTETPEEEKKEKKTPEKIKTINEVTEEEESNNSEEKEKNENEEEIKETQAPKESETKTPETPEENTNTPEGEIKKKDISSFCFSLTKNKIYKHKEDKEEAILCSKNYGPTFLGNIFCVKDKMLTNGGFSGKVEDSYFDDLEKDFEISGEQEEFKIKELEVFEIIVLP